ncbi:MAG TPA: type II secretion system protein GspM [Acidobacteriota bacterium]|nr:type II secretion system protein GspM [Acidobacteriota bacterium]
MAKNRLKNLSRRDRRAVVGLTAIVGVMVVVFFIILPFVDAQAEVKEELDQQASLLQRTLSTIENQDAYRQRLSQLDSEMRILESRLLDATNPTLAQTHLLEILKFLEQQNGVQITRSSPIPERNEGSYTRVTMQINLECDIVSLTGFLRSIAEHEKFLLVDEFNLNVGRSRRSRQEVLRPRLRISAWIRLS